MRIVRLRAGLAAGLAMVGGLAACAPARITGRDFPLQPFNEFTLKKTTDQDVRNALGEPFQSNMLTQTVTNSNTPFPVGTPLTITKLNYMYNTSNGGPETGGRPAIKMAIFQFFGGIMFSDVFLSTFPNDAMPGFDESKLSLLRQGVTTRREVIALALRKRE